MSILFKIKEKKLLDILLFITVIIFYYKIFVIYEHYPLHDEVIALDRYIEWKNFLRKDIIGNHTLNSFIAAILNSFFGYDFINLRLISFVSLILILLFFRLQFSSIFLYLIFLTVITSSNILFNYSYIFRGYYVAAFLSVAIFFFLKKYFNDTNNIKVLRILFFLIFLQFFHSLFTIYIAIPSLMIIFFTTLKKKITKEIIYSYIFFSTSVISIYILFSFIDGFVLLHNSNLTFDFLLKNFFNIFIPCTISGFEKIFFSELTESNFFAIKSVFESMYYGVSNIYVAEPFFLLIYLLSFLLAVFNLIKLKMTDHLSNTILLIFIFFILISKAPPLRAFTGSVFFCLFYIINYFSYYKLPYKNIISKISFVLCFALIINVSPNENFQQTKETVMRIDKFKTDCINANDKLSQYEIWVLINYYPNQCGYKYNKKLKANILYDK